MYQLTNDRNANIALVKKLANETYPNQPILAKLAAAQAILESSLTNIPSDLAKDYNNLFGIKGSGTAGSVDLYTHEEVKGKLIEIKQPFSVNKTLLDSFLQHKKILGFLRYANLQYATTFEEAAQLIYEDGYATDSKYPQKLIGVYKRFLRDEE